MQSWAGRAVLTVLLRNRKSNSSFLHCFLLQHSPWLIKIAALTVILQLWPCSAEKDLMCFAGSSLFQQKYPFLGAKKGTLPIPWHAWEIRLCLHITRTLTQAKGYLLKHCRCFWYPRRELFLLCWCMHCSASLTENLNVASVTVEGFREGCGFADLGQA